jgi:hypothetical protein
VAGKRKPRTLLEVNVLLTAASLLTEEELSAGKKLPLMRQAQLMLKAMPKATRIAEFVALWTIAKAGEGASTAESVAQYWNQAPRTMYRRLEEFREVWAPAEYDTPDKLADHLVADYRRRKERIEAGGLAKMLSAEVPTPPLDSAIASGS